MGILPVFFTVSGPLLQETPRASMLHIAAAEVLKRTPPGEVRDNLVTICNDRKLALCTLEGGPGCGKSQFVIQLLQELTKHPETDRLHFFTFPTRVLRDQMIARLRSEGVQFLPLGKGPMTKISSSRQWVSSMSCSFQARRRRRAKSYRFLYFSR